MAEQYGITAYDAGVLANDRAHADFFEAACKAAPPELAKLVCNWFMVEALAVAAKSGVDVCESKLTPQALADLVVLLSRKTINGPTAKELLPELFEKGGDVKRIVQERGLGQVSDGSAIAAFAKQAVEANPKSVADFKSGKAAALQFLVGQVMKFSRGKADPKAARAAIEELLK